MKCPSVFAIRFFECVILSDLPFSRNFANLQFCKNIFLYGYNKSWFGRSEGGGGSSQYSIFNIPRSPLSKPTTTHFYFILKINEYFPTSFNTPFFFLFSSFDLFHSNPPHSFPYFGPFLYPFHLFPATSFPAHFHPIPRQVFSTLAYVSNLHVTFPLFAKSFSEGNIFWSIISAI